MTPTVACAGAIKERNKMTELTTRLRKYRVTAYSEGCHPQICDEAAAEIDLLVAEIKELHHQAKNLHEIKAALMDDQFLTAFAAKAMEYWMDMPIERDFGAILDQTDPEKQSIS